jgi:uncharacterized protein
MKKKIVVAGATGLVGKTLCHELITRGYELIVVTRDIASAKLAILEASKYIDWSDTKDLEDAVGEAYGIINLAGSPIVGKRWTEDYKKILLDSRTTTTKHIVEAIKKATIKPQVLINGSAVGYYGIIPDATARNETASPGSDFLAKICVAWEKEAIEAEQFGTRVVCIRTAIVLDKNEGALPRMLTPFYYSVGGPIGSGKQWFPWVHVKDEVGIICFALENDNVKGAINSVSPDVVTNKTFAAIIGKVLNKPSFIPVPSFVLKLMFGEAAVVITTGIKISAQKITDLGYTFQYPKLQQALESILK